MCIGERIQKLGFKRWYERTLIEGHVYLVSSFLGMILAFAGVEMFGEPDGALWGLIAAVAGAVVVMFATPRYFRTLALAEALGGRAHCPRCKVYAAFNVLAFGPRKEAQSEEPSEGGSVWLKVKCRQCENEWRMFA